MNNMPCRPPLYRWDRTTEPHLAELVCRTSWIAPSRPCAAYLVHADGGYVWATTTSLGVCIRPSTWRQPFRKARSCVLGRAFCHEHEDCRRSLSLALECAA